MEKKIYDLRTELLRNVISTSIQCFPPCTEIGVLCTHFKRAHGRSKPAVPNLSIRRKMCIAANKKQFDL